MKHSRQEFNASLWNVDYHRYLIILILLSLSKVLWAIDTVISEPYSEYCKLLPKTDFGKIDETMFLLEHILLTAILESFTKKNFTLK